MKIYLAGPINGCTDAEANDWRSAVKKIHPDCLDPMARDYRGKEDENIGNIVEGDKRDIDETDALIVYFEKPSAGTCMEILYAWERKKPIALIDKSNRPLSPWLRYHCSYFCNDVEDAVWRLGSHFNPMPTSHLAFTDPANH